MEVAPREQMILLRDDPPLPTQMWVLAPQPGWTGWEPQCAAGVRRYRSAGRELERLPLSVCRADW